MTAKSKEKVELERSKKDETYTLTWRGLTRGQILSLKYALRKHAETSPVGYDTLVELGAGINKTADGPLKKVFEED